MPNIHRQLTQLLGERNRRQMLGQIGREIDRLVSRDETLDLGIRFLTPPMFERLSARNKQKVADRILDDVKEGARTRGPKRGVFHHDARKIFPALTPADRTRFLRLVETALMDEDPQRRTYGAWMASWISRSLVEAERVRLAHANSRSHRVWVCPPCLTFVAFALDSGDEARARREVRRLAPVIWEEGLELAVVLALENAKRDEVAGASVASEDVRVHAWRSLVVEAVVWRLAEQLVEDMRRRRRGDSKMITS